MQAGGDTAAGGSTEIAGTSGEGGSTAEAGSGGDDGGTAGAAGSTELCPTLVGPHFVSTTGSDDNPGTEALPFRTLQRAADVVIPGDVVTVAGGLYRERVKMRSSGTAEAPIRFQAASDEVVVVSGADYLDVTWEELAAGIWAASVPSPVTQLFVDGQAMVDARFPNTTPDHLVDGPMARAGEGTTPEALIDTELPDGDLTGAYVNAMAGSAWYSYTRRVAAYDQSTRTASFDAAMKDPNPELPLDL